MAPKRAASKKAILEPKPEPEPVEADPITEVCSYVYVFVKRDSGM